MANDTTFQMGLAYACSSMLSCFSCNSIQPGSENQWDSKYFYRLKGLYVGVWKVHNDWNHGDLLYYPTSSRTVRVALQKFVERAYRALHQDC